MRTGRLSPASYVCVAAAAFLMLACGEPDRGADVVARGSTTPELPFVLAAPGRVEGASEVVEVGAGIDGIVAEVLVEEGQRVAAREVLVRLSCTDLEARLGAAGAEVEVLRQGRLRMVRGRREEERRTAAAATAAASATLERARQRHARLARLAAEGSVVSVEDIDSARRDVNVAQAAHRMAVEQEALTNAEPLPEELRRSDAEILAAERRAKEEEARVQKCTVISPLSGTVLRIHLQAGEQVSLAYPRPLVSIADTSRFRVRAEVDERDLGKVRVGQEVVVVFDAMPEGRLNGRVVRLEPIMGRKQVRTGDPSEKSDRDVQEVLVDLLEGTPNLVVGLRVTALFLER